MHRIVPSKEIGLSSMHNLILMQKNVLTVIKSINGRIILLICYL